MPAITTNDLKNGITLQLDNGLFTVVEFQHVKPGKGGAFVRTKLRNVRSGATLERTFNAGIRVEQAIVDKRDMQFLYTDGDDYVFMDTHSYDQTNVPRSRWATPPTTWWRPMVAMIAMFEGEVVQRRDPRLGGAHHQRDRARGAGRSGLRRPQAGHPRDRQGHPGAAVRQHRRQGAGRHPLRRLHHPGCGFAPTFRRLPEHATTTTTASRISDPRPGNGHWPLLYEARRQGAQRAPDVIAALPVPPDEAGGRSWWTGVEHRRRGPTR